MPEFVKENGAGITIDNVYSTSEIDTGKTWIDGKTIYRKVIDYGALSNTGDKAVAHGINDADMIRIKEAVCYIQDGDGFADLTHLLPDRQMLANRTNVTVYGATGHGHWSMYVILEYTKV